jgi:cytochrome c-type biogenesis protein
MVSWDLPISYPPGTSIQGMWSLALVMSLSEGLLSAVLTPCLLQLVVVYFALMAGTSIGANTGRVDRRRVLLLSLAFVSAFTVLYTAAGALIGHLGHQAQMLFAAINRPAAIVSGVIIILLAAWTARNSRVALVCRLPLPALIDRADQGGVARAALTAAAFSVGCMTCFGGAIVGTLLMYVGSLGSAAVGAAIMLTFSAGVAIPFLAAAFVIVPSHKIGERNGSRAALGWLCGVGDHGGFWHCADDRQFPCAERLDLSALAFAGPAIVTSAPLWRAAARTRARQQMPISWTRRKQ